MDLLGLGFKASILAATRSQVKALRSNVSRETQVRRRSVDTSLKFERYPVAVKEGHLPSHSERGTDKLTSACVALRNGNGVLEPGLSTVSHGCVLESTPPNTT